ncbi:hypothetical protein AX16_007288 [Volvariella volvacea WC 439]|nr:hypothetical protein AX16_007288 [Volvariella volvacea WC 439]
MAPYTDDDDDYSDLTDLDDEEEEYSAKSKGKKKQTKRSSPGSGWKIRNALKVPRATTYTAQSLYDQIHNGDINLEPEYQRDVVWPESKQVGLIDSVFRNFYIPPVIFVVNSYDDGSETKTCIDGKQRLTSIHRFMDGLIPHKDPHTGEKLWYKDVGNKGGRAKRLLPDKYRRLFANKQIVCVEYQDITDNDEREIFQRVQLGMALTPAEKLAVINTPRAEFIREIQSHFLHSSDDPSSISAGAFSSAYLDWERSRGADFRCLAQSVFIMERYAPSAKGLAAMPQLERWMRQEGQLDEVFKKKAWKVFEIFAEIIRDSREEVSGIFREHWKVSPVEFISISLLIARHGNIAIENVHVNGKKGGASASASGAGTGIWMEGLKLEYPQLSRAIAMMKDQVRGTHADVRLNDRVMKTLMEFINGLTLEQLPGIALTGINGTANAIALAAKLNNKRVRGASKDGETEDQDMEPPPAKAKARKTGPTVAPLPTPIPSQRPQVPTPAPMHTTTEATIAQVSGQGANTGPDMNSSTGPPRLRPASERMAAMRATKARIAAERSALLDTQGSIAASLPGGPVGSTNPNGMPSLSSNPIPGFGTFAVQGQYPLQMGLPSMSGAPGVPTPIPTPTPTPTNASATHMQYAPTMPAISTAVQMSNAQMLPSPSNSSSGGTRTPRLGPNGSFGGANGHGGVPGGGGGSIPIPLPMPHQGASSSSTSSYGNQASRYQGR